MPTQQKTVGIVDDDAALRDSLGLVLRFRNFRVLEFQSGEEALEALTHEQMDCMVLDIRLPGKSGLEVLEKCREMLPRLPIIVVTAYGDVSSAKRALKRGAHDFLEKPIHEDEMTQAINSALETSEREASLIAQREELRDRVASLSSRERRVFYGIMSGRHNREIASELALSVRTIEVFKSRVMEKMKVSRIAELVKLATRFGITD